MRRILTATCIRAVCSASAGCDERATPAQGYQRWKDKIVAATHIPFFGFKGLCDTRWVSDKFGGYYDHLPPDQCYKMDAPRHWSGLWRDEFEGSRFCPGPATECSFDSPGEKIWFEYSFGMTQSRPAERKVPPGGLYLVDFVGRRSTYRGQYGHMGGSDRFITVNRMISIKEIEPPPPPPTPAEELAGWKQCLADKTCFPTAEGKARIKELEAQVK